MAKSLTSPIGVLAFPNIFKPRAPVPGGDERFSLILVFDDNAQNSPAYKTMKKAVMDVAIEKWGETRATDMIKKGQLRMPFRDASEKGEYAGFEDGKVFISAWSKQKPDVIDGELEDVMPSDVFPGCLARITYKPFAYETSGNRGVSIGLNNVQIADFTTPRLDGKKKGADDFDQLDTQSSSSSAELEEDDLPF